MSSVQPVVCTYLYVFNQPESTSLIDYGRLQRDGELRVKSHDDNKFKSRYKFYFVAFLNALNVIITKLTTLF